jgi:predicted XRE-type DNA-binding protein
MAEAGHQAQPQMFDFQRPRSATKPSVDPGAGGNAVSLGTDYRSWYIRPMSDQVIAGQGKAGTHRSSSRTSARASKPKRARSGTQGGRHNAAANDRFCITTRKHAPERTGRLAKIEKSSGNVYADLSLPDAGEMLVKAQLALNIARIIKRRRLTQKDAAGIMGLSQAKVSDMLRGRFRGISEAKMLDCLTALGNDIEIRLKPIRRRKTPGSINVVFAG